MLNGKYKKQRFTRIVFLVVLVIFISALSNEAFGNSSNTYIRSTISIPHTNGLAGIVYDPLNHYIYVAYPGTVIVINDRTNKIIQNISLGKFLGGIQVPLNMEYDPLNNTIYINTLNLDIIIINCSTNKIESEIKSIGFNFIAFNKNKNICTYPF